MAQIFVNGVIAAVPTSSGRSNKSFSAVSCMGYGGKKVMMLTGLIAASTVYDLPISENKDMQLSIASLALLMTLFNTMNE